MATTDKVQVGGSTVSTSTSTSTTWHCPYTPSKAEQGWECPRCGRINAPWARQCNCSNRYDKWDITWTSNIPEYKDWWDSYIACGKADTSVYTTDASPTVGGSDYWDQYTKTWTNVPNPINKKE